MSGGPRKAVVGTATHREGKEDGGHEEICQRSKQFVPEMLQGLVAANPDTLKYVPEYNLIMRAAAPNVRLWGWKNFIDEDLPTLDPAQTYQVQPTPDLVTYQ